MTTTSSLLTSQEVLRKHLNLEGDTVIVISMVKGIVHVDISAPGNIGELLLMQKILDIHITRTMVMKIGD